MRWECGVAHVEIDRTGLYYVFKDPGTTTNLLILRFPNQFGCNLVVISAVTEELFINFNLREAIVQRFQFRKI